MNLKELRNEVVDLLKKHDFELIDEDICDEISLHFLNKDFRIEFSYDSDYNEADILFDRGPYSIDAETKSKNINNIINMVDFFLKKIDDIIIEEGKLPIITNKDCELFLQTGSMDGLSSGVIEENGSLFYIEIDTNLYHRDKYKLDSDNGVWRNYYVYELTKKELESIVISSLDWLRHINLTSLCKNWQSMSLSTGDEASHELHFNGKYRSSPKIQGKPIKKLKVSYLI